MFDKRPSQCLSCRHLRSVELSRDPDAFTCAAFPGGVPEQISTNHHDHRAFFPGDGGVRFEQDPAAPAFDHSGLPDLNDKWASEAPPVVVRARQCDACLWFESPGCLAFPEGVPADVLTGALDHRYPVPGDDGVRFLQDPSKPAHFSDAPLSGDELAA